MIGAVAGGLLGGVASGLGTYFAAKEQASAAKRGVKEQGRQFDYQKGLAEPVYNDGRAASGLLNAVYGVGYGDNQGQLAGDRAQFTQNFESSPIYQQYYQNAIQNANQGIERNASATGRLNSGQTLMALSDRAGNLAGNTLNSYMGGIQGIAQQGNNAMNSLTGSSQNYGNAAAQGAYNVGNANAAGYMGMGNTVNNTLGDIAQGYGQQQGYGAQGSSGYASMSGYGPQNIVPNSYYGG